ncbi:MAG TPA: FAD-dependent oxidoreductase [Gammaproteobacteria bacterium]|nr:FAD-dependent oxidoreductase [Gammaproteobacteria bacterium]
MDTININPPKLTAANFGRQITCYRPKHNDYPNMSIQKVGNKIIAHNYGHGAKGWTLAPGGANYVNDKLISSEFAEGLKSDTPITIVGAGVIGLFTAYDLLQKGYTNLSIVATSYEDLTSNFAGGLVYLGMERNIGSDPAMLKLIKEISLNSYHFYSSIAKHAHKHFKDVAVFLPLYLSERIKDFDFFTEKLALRAKDVVLDFGNGIKRPVVAYENSIFIHTDKMLHDLLNYLQGNGVNCKQQTINAFTDLSDRFIINCTGLGAKKLNNDDNLISVQGHLIMLLDQNPEDMQYMIDIPLDEYTNSLGQHVRRSFYMFPKRFIDGNINAVGVIGGTFIEGATDVTPNAENFALLMQAAKDYFGHR